jgi:hypothetical protein
LRHLPPIGHRRRRNELPQTSGGPQSCRAKFLRIFPGGFSDVNYLAWERDYKWSAHREWDMVLGRSIFAALLRDGAYEEIAGRAVKIESKTNLIFSFEKMALRDAVRPPSGARDFSHGLYRFLYDAGEPATKFDRWCEVVAGLPRRQTRVLTWPIVTVFGFIALPKIHFFVKPKVTREAARAWRYALAYESRPSWKSYAGMLAFAADARRGLRTLRPRDLIDIQSFLWVQGSDEYLE